MADDTVQASATSVATLRGTRSRLRIIPVIEVVLLAIFAVLPLVIPDDLVSLVARVLILALLALSFDLVWGYAGILSFGQALFFGTAGYSVALLARDLNVTSIFIVLPASLLIGLVLSFLLAAFLLLGRYPPTVIFVALGTLAGSYIADRLARAWYYLGGQNGIPSFPAMTAGHYEFTDEFVFYYLDFTILVLVYLLCRFVVRSQFGLALAGIREQEARIAFFGYKVQHLKAIVFSLAGAIAGLAGGLYAFHEGFVWPNMLSVGLSTQIVLYALFGGVGTLIGPVIGVTVIELLTYYLSDQLPEQYRGIWPIVLGVVLLLVIMFQRTGLIGLVVSERERFGSFGGQAHRRGKGGGDGPA